MNPAARLEELNDRVATLKTEVAWYAAACYRDGAWPTERDGQYLRHLCARLDAAQAVANAEVQSLRAAGVVS